MNITMVVKRRTKTNGVTVKVCVRILSHRLLHAMAKRKNTKQRNFPNKKTDTTMTICT